MVPPEELSGEYVAAMEDVLMLYEMPYDARYPTVCLDEKPVVLHAEVRPGLPPAPGQVERRDYEYERHGTANLFVMVEPLVGWRHVAVTEHRTKQDYAECLRYLVWSRNTTRTPNASTWSKTTSIPTPPARSTTPSRPHRPAPSWTGWSSIPRPSMGVG